MPLKRLDAGRLEQVLEPEAWRRLQEAGDLTARVLRGRRLWHINSNAMSGGVAELLSWFLPLTADAGVDVRWLVLEAEPAFFELTKRIHHLLHENPRELDGDDRGRYEDTLRPAAEQVKKLVRSGDVVVVHDPQPAGLIPVLAGAGALVVWRCHVGTDHPGPEAHKAWTFLQPFVARAQKLVFSRRQFVWDRVDGRARIIQPAIDPLAPKNQELDPSDVRAILGAAGILKAGHDGDAPVFLNSAGSEGRVRRRADILQERAVPPGVPIVSQVSRWDPLKDPTGVIRGFAQHVARTSDAHLVLAGPRVTAVEDDPEGSRVLEEVRATWRSLPDDVRARVHIASLPMDDVEENAAMVNALQRASDVVVQKSLHEGFGLTVVEAMWKGRPIVASRVGGIQEQIEDEESGLLLDDPRDLRAFGGAVTRLLRDQGLRERLGKEARVTVRRSFLPDRPASDWAELLRELTGEGSR